MYRIFGFEPIFDKWADDQGPSDDLRVLVMNWLHVLQVDPYFGARPSLHWGMEWWQAEIPDSWTDKDVTVCIYRVLEEKHEIHVSALATLSLPLMDDDQF